MKLEELEKYIDEQYGVKMWSSSNLKRFYFKHTPKINTYIDVITKGENVIKITSRCIYLGRPNSENWINKYSKNARNFLDEIINDINSLHKKEVKLTSN